MSYIVNGKKVEYLYIRRIGEDIVVEFSEKFNIVSAHMSVIMGRVRDAGFECQVFKDLGHGIISIWLNDVDDVHGVLCALGVPAGVYEVVEGGRIVVVDVHLLLGRL